MILTCPECATKFAVPDAALGTAGRKVRCAVCAHKWWQNPEAEAPAAAVIEEPAPEVSSFFAPPPENSGLEELEQSLPSAEMPLTAMPLGDDEDEGFSRRAAARAAASAAKLPVANENAAGGSARLAWGIVGAVALVLLLGLCLPRHKIMAAWPNTAHFYRTVGLAPTEVGTGLEIRDARSFVKSSTEGKVLTIEGDIANTGKQARQAPDLQAVETNNSASTGSWTFPPGVTSLPAGKSAHFKVSFPATGETSGNIVLTFVAKAPDEGKNGHK